MSILEAFDLVQKAKLGETSDGSTASYYELPTGATQLQDLISERDMNAQIGEIFRACYRYGRVSHSNRLRDAKKILFYAEAEVARLKKQFERYPCGCTDWEKQHCRGENSPFAEHPDCQRMQPPEAGDCNG